MDLDREGQSHTTPLADDVTAPTLVIEDGVVLKSVRRPADLLRLVLVVVAAVLTLAIAYFASNTASGIGADVTDALQSLPGWLLLPISLVSGLGILILPVGVAIDLLARRRGRQLVDSLGASVLAILLVAGLAWAAQRYAPDSLWRALSGDAERSANPFYPLLAAIIAFSATARLVERARWSILTGIVVAGTMLSLFINGSFTITGLTLTVLLGWAVGLLARYVLGTPTTRPPGTAVAEALERAGLSVSVLRATRITAEGRRYSATTDEGERLQVVVLDRDLEGSGLLSRGWRTLRLRDDDAYGGLSMRGTLERSALMTYAAEAIGAPTPRLRAVSEIGPDAAMLAYDHIDGQPFDMIDVTDADLRGAWESLRILHDHRIGHRALSADHLLRDPDGSIWLLDMGAGVVAMRDLQERIDIAELLATTAALTTPERAVAAGREVLGDVRLSRALPVVQPVAFSPATRKAVRRQKDLLKALREELIDITPEGEVEQVNLERVRPRTLLTIVAGLVAAYILLGQLAQVDLLQLFRDADWQWVGIAAVLSALTFVGAAMALQGFVIEKLSLFRTFLAQLAAGFATLVTPPTLGTVAINVRYLQRSGVHPAVAGASVGVSQIVAFFVHIGLLFVAGVLAGTQQDFAFDPPREAIIVVAALALCLVVVLPLPPIRRWLFTRAKPTFERVGPRLVAVAQRPAKLLTGIGGILLLNVAFCACLVASVHAFGGSASIWAIALVYLAGSTLGQAAPTPGGVGAVEAVMTAGLVGVGVDSGVALSSVLLFRLLTFWLPTIPGWLSFQWLTRHGSL